MGQLKDKLKDVPRKPGVYKFLDQAGKVLYVGKAKNLRARLSQYFGKSDNRPQLPFLMAESTDFDYVVVRTELESLFLENTLIKEYMPPYNIMLRDDKNFAFIQIDYSTQIPQINYVRKIEQKSIKLSPPFQGGPPAGGERQRGRGGSITKNKFFGPYTSTKKIMQTLDAVRKIFHFCNNKEVGKRPCFYYHLHRCPGVCIGQISLKEYEKHLQKIAEFLSGHSTKIRISILAEMQSASRNKRFELAARLRDQNHALLMLDEKQITVLAKNVAWDIVSIHQNPLSACINLFKVREGKLRDKENFIFDHTNALPQKEAHHLIIQKFLEDYYSSTTDLPTEIIVESVPNNPGLIQSLLKSRSKKKIHVVSPTRGEKLKLVKLGKVNAEEFLLKWERNQATNLDAINQTLKSLQKILKLPTLPKRIEGFDISNIQGTNPVGSMVVAKDGLPAKSEYRKFKITGKNTPDDFAMMREMLTRRLSHMPNSLTVIPNTSPVIPDSSHVIPGKAGIHNVIASGAKQSPNTSPVIPDTSLLGPIPSIASSQAGIQKNQWPAPDLLVIDGGKGQLGIAVEVLKQLKLKIPVIGLAKRIEEIFLPHKSKPIVLPHEDPVLQLLQRLRDEAHRFGITFHKSLRSKQAVKSALDEIPGIGPKTKKLLKQKIGTIADIRKTPISELEKLVGKAKADLIKQSL